MAVPSNSTPAPDAPLNLYQLQHLRMVAAGAVGVLPEPQALEMHGLWSDLGRRMIEAPITCPADALRKLDLLAELIDDPDPALSRLIGQVAAYVRGARQ